MSVRRQISPAASAGKGGKPANARISSAPCAPFDARVQDQKNAPIPGEGQRRDHGRDLRVRASARVDREAAALEQRRAHARSRAAIGEARILAHVLRQLCEPPKRRRDRERELRPRAESGVGRNRLRDDELFARVEAKRLGDATREMRAALALLAQNLEARRSAKMNAGEECVDGETDRTELSAEVSVKIEKAQMQARRRCDLNAFQLRPSSSRSTRRRLPVNLLELCETLRVLPSRRRDQRETRPRNCWRPRRAPEATSVAMLRPLIQNVTVPWRGAVRVGLTAGGR